MRVESCKVTQLIAMIFSVCALPLDESLVLATDGEHALRIRCKGSTHDVLAMTRVALRGMAVVDGRVAEDID